MEKEIDELKALVARRKQLAQHLASVNNAINALENEYVQHSTYGNIMNGYNGFVSRHTPRLENTRLFSRQIYSDDEDEYME